MVPDRSDYLQMGMWTRRRLVAVSIRPPRAFSGLHHFVAIFTSLMGVSNIDE